MLIVMTSASGNGSVRKSPLAVVTRSVAPAASMAALAIGSTTGRSKLVQRRWVWRAATMSASWPVAPPMSHRSPVGAEVESLGEREEACSGDVAHGPHELLQPDRVAVKVLEHRLSGALHFVLRFARA